MKYHILFFMLCLFTTSISHSQNMCETPYQFSTSDTLSFALPVNAGSAPAGPNYGCLGSTNNPTWVQLNICLSGNMTLQLSTSAGTGIDVDYVIWGPFSNSLTNTQICDSISSGNTAPPFCSYGQFGPEFCNMPNVNAGNIYVMMVTNPSNSAGTGYLYQSSGSGYSCDSSQLSGGCFPSYLPLCQVTMDNSNTYHKIMWEKIPGFNAANYEIFREETSLNNYISIGSVPESDSSFFIDTGADPMQQPYRYKIRAQDSCLNYTAMSDYHQTLHLQVTPGINNTNNLQWTNYIGITGFPSWYILRGPSSASLSVIDTIPSWVNTYTDLNPPGGINYYQVALVNPDPCNVTRSYNDAVRSNVPNSTLTGMHETENEIFSVFPNPADETVFIKGPGNVAIQRLVISDVSGREILSENTRNTTMHQLEVSQIAPGTYFLFIVTGHKTYIHTLIVG